MNEGDDPLILSPEQIRSMTLDEYKVIRRQLLGQRVVFRLRNVRMWWW